MYLQACPCLQLTAEREELANSEVWSSVDARQSFAAKCQDLFTKHKVSPLIAAKYYKVHLEVFLINKTSALC